MRLEMKSSRLTASLCSRTKSKLLVEPAWLLKATQGEMISIKAAPLCAIAALIIGTSCSLSPEKERATNEAPSWSAIATRSIELSVLIKPRFDFEPRSAAEIGRAQ